MSTRRDWWGHPHWRWAWGWGHSSWESTRRDRRGHQISLGNSPRESRGSPRRGNSSSSSRWSKAWGLHRGCVITNSSLRGGLGLHGGLCGCCHWWRGILCSILTDWCSWLAVHCRSRVLQDGWGLSCGLLGIGPRRLGIGNRGSVLIVGGSIRHGCIACSSLERWA